MRSIIKWIGERRWCRVLLWIGVSLVTVVVLIHQVENWRGARAWNDALKLMEREGETLDLKALEPAPIPDEENFGAIPVLEGIGVVVDDDIEKGEGASKRRRLEGMGLALEGKKRAKVPSSGFGYELGMVGDVEANWAAYFQGAPGYEGLDFDADPAVALLEGLGRHDELIGELAAGLSRSQAQLIPSWASQVGDRSAFEMTLPHYNSMMTATRTLGLRATAGALAGEGEIAAESLLIGLKFAQASAADGLTIGTLVAITQFTLVDAALWQCLNARVLTEESLARVQGDLEQLDFSASLLQAMRAEVAGMVQALDYAERDDPAQWWTLISGIGEHRDQPGPMLGSLTFRLVPTGWFDQNRATVVSWQMKYCLQPLKEEGLRGLIEAGHELEEVIKSSKASFHPHRIIATIAMPALQGIGRRALYAEALRRMSVTACAVERYFLRAGKYPDSLAALVGAGLLEAVPLDLVEETPLRYRREAENGRYEVWSVGIDEADGGGVRVLDEKRGAERTRFYDSAYEGDWVWGYPKRDA
jgi:hypothetical protein